MISSMTGYGRSQQVLGGKDITVEIKAVNHRFFEFSSRIPRAYGYLEEKIKGYVQQKVSRGKVDVNVTILHGGGVGRKRTDKLRFGRPVCRRFARDTGRAEFDG